MKTLTAIAILAFLLLAGCASQSGAQQNQAPSSGQPAGKGFTFTDSSNLTTTNGTQAGTAGGTTQPAQPPPPANNTTIVTSGSGGQIVDVGGSIPVNSGPSGSGN